jgi:hypothetical protein
MSEAALQKNLLSNVTNNLEKKQGQIRPKKFGPKEIRGERSVALQFIIVSAQ